MNLTPALTRIKVVLHEFLLQGKESGLVALVNVDLRFFLNDAKIFVRHKSSR